MKFKNLKISAKLSIGFGILMFISLIVGGIAIVNMKDISRQSGWLSNEYVPEVQVSNKIERYALQTMYNMRGYTYSNNKQYLEISKENLSKIKTNIQDAQKLASQSEKLSVLGASLDKMLESVSKYEKLAQETEEVSSLLEEEYQVMADAAIMYLDASEKYLDNQNRSMISEIRNERTSLERLEKMTLINSILHIGNAMRIENLKAQARREPEMLESALTKFDDIDKLINRLLEITYKKEDIKEIEDVKTAAKMYEGAIVKYLANWKKKEKLNKERDIAGEGVLQEAQEVSEAGIANTIEISKGATDNLDKASSIMVVGLVVALLLGFVSASVITRVITTPLKKGVVAAKRISAGDLKTNIEIDQNDEVGELAKALQGMINKLREVVTYIKSGADNISSASLQLSSSSQSMSQGASEQASSVEQISSSMEEMVSNIQQNTDNAMQTEKIAITSVDGIRESSNSARISIEAMNNIAEKIKIINDIAFQTNILALNAAVEAARAGEHGKGFAVVAAEVRKLAERSKVAADEINELSVKGVKVSDMAGEKLSSIVPEIEKTAKLVQEIAAASSEQNSGADQINSAIQQLNIIVQQNAASSEEMATSSEELSGQADQLKEIIDFFQVDENVVFKKKKSTGVQFVEQDLRIAKKEKRKEEINKQLSPVVELEPANDNEFEKF